jgi:hypothetical protein
VICVLLYRSLAWIFAVRLRRRGTCELPSAWTKRLHSLACRARVWQPVVLLESCLAEVPVVIGYLRPVILIPAGMLTGLPAEPEHYRRIAYAESHPSGGAYQRPPEEGGGTTNTFPF